MSNSRSSGPVGPAKDVLALFDKAHLGNVRYLTFAQKPHDEQDKKDKKEKPEAAPVVATPEAPLANGENLRRALSSVLEANARLRVDVNRPRPTQGATLAFASCAGGVGKTTICATVARVFSSRVNNVLVADRCVDGIIPYFFGLERLQAGGLQMVYPNARRTGYQMTLVVAPSEEAGNSSRTAWMEQLRGEASLTLFDFPTFQGASAQSLLDRTQVVVPLAPDVQSLASIARIESLAAASEGSQSASQSGRSLFVLNRYEDARALHREIRAQLEKTLGDRLAPMAVRESEHVPEALAQGMTVLDYAPQLPVVQDFEQVGQWLEARLAHAAAAQEKVEIA